MYACVYVCECIDDICLAISFVAVLVVVLALLMSLMTMTITNNDVDDGERGDHG